MNVLIAKTREECAHWKGIVVVIDVLRSATTQCVFVKRKKEGVAFADFQKAVEFIGKHPEFELFSGREIDFPHQDNSPYLADKSSAKKPAILTAASGLSAAWKARQADAVVMGGFCNFETLAETLSAQEKDVLLIPASLFDAPDDVEDVLCAEALKDYIQGIGTPERALGEMGNTVRLAEFKKQGPKTAEKDAKFAFKINGIPVIPQLSFVPGTDYAVWHAFGSPVPEKWLPLPETPAVEEKNVLPAEPTVTENPSTEEKPTEQPEAVAVSAPQMPSEELPEKTALPEKNAEEVSLPVEEKEKQESSREQKERNIFSEKTAQAIHAKSKEAKSKLKGFFSNIVRSVKEEKRELEESLFGRTSSNVTRHSTEYTPQNEDPLDAILKAASAQQPKPAEMTEEKAPLETSESLAADLPQKKQISEPLPVQQNPEDAVEKQPSSAENHAPLEKGDTSFSAKQNAFGDKKKKKAIVLFSGGLDSTTCLYWALAQGYECETLTISYGQRHDREVLAAQMIARNLGVKQHLITLDLPWLASSSLVDKNQAIPDVEVENISKGAIPSTYVPGRNLMFLSVAGSLLDAIGADAIVAGPNAIDFSGYPDCTPAFFKSAAEALNRGTKMGVTEGIEVLAPLMRLSKAEIVKLAASLKVPFELTWSCYAGGKTPCGHCDSCKLRARGFEEAGVKDTALGE